MINNDYMLTELNRQRRYDVAEAIAAQRDRTRRDTQRLSRWRRRTRPATAGSAGDGRRDRCRRLDHRLVHIGAGHAAFSRPAQSHFSCTPQPAVGADHMGGKAPELA
jgi:hypothetical protein